MIAVLIALCGLYCMALGHTTDGLLVFVLAELMSIHDSLDRQHV
jgi:hypothetical protein